VMLCVAGIRVLDAYLPDSVFGESHTWAAEGILGVLLSLVGLALWSRRSPKA
jgi:hypothetical protein